MVYSFLSYLIPALLLVVAGMMAYRGLHKEFPYFFSYLVAVIVFEIIRFSLFHLKLVLPYFYSYWITEAVEVVLGFLVLYEVFLIRLFPRFNVTVIYRRLFPAVGIIVVALTAWVFISAPSIGPSRIVAIIGACTMALNFCQVAFGIFFAGLMIYM